MKDTRPQDNDALRPGFHLPAKQAPRFSGDAPPPLEDDFTDSYMGWRLTQGRGVYARFDLPDAPIPIGGAPGTGIIYAPTTTPANYGCVEITGIHYNDRTVWGAPYGDAFGVWDWCHNTHDFRYVTNSSAYAFRDPYVRSYTDEYGQTKKGYFITLSEQNPGSPVHSGDCWSALLYNFNRGLWEEKWTSCGVSERNDVYGWIMHETNDMAGVVNNTCFSMKSIAAAYVMIQLPSGDWISGNGLYNGSPLYDSGLTGPPVCVTNGTWSVTYLTNQVGWRALTPGSTW